MRALFSLCVGLMAIGCSSGEPSTVTGLGGSGGSGGGSGGGSAGTTVIGAGGTGTAASGGSAGTTIIGTSGSGTSGGSGGSGGIDACETVSTGATLQPVYLVFAFDVSGSMGKGDYDWHDRTLKWDPVVAATKAFFEDPASMGFEASLTVFPDGDGDDERCEDATYAMPDVAMTALPSPTFGVTLDAIGAEEWRGGTPTLHVVRGTLGQIEQARTANPGHYALVLVTDGYPQGCDDNEIASVVTEVQAAAATTPTYVIGVANPPIDGAPDTVTDLAAIAMAGGTTDAFIIDTGNPTDTVSRFRAVVEQIRDQALSCSITIPAPPGGREFDKNRVEVTYTSGATTTPLVYDPTCAAPSAWHYDDPANPTSIELCEATCTTVQADAMAGLGVNFACQDVIDVK
jgi:hypothetical protein